MTRSPSSAPATSAARSARRRQGGLRRRVRRPATPPRPQAVAAAAGATAAATLRDAVGGRGHRRPRRPLQRGRRRRGRDRPGRRRQGRHRPHQPAQARLLRSRHRARPVGRRGARRGCSPGRKVVKAFNTLFAGNTAQPAGARAPARRLFATDDEAAKDAVCGLSASIGFRPIHVGPLAAARELEAMAWLNIRLQLISNGNWNTAFALVSPPEAALTYGK